MNSTTAAIEWGRVSGAPLNDGVVATVLYFGAGIVVLLAGFVMLDALTPGNLRRQVYVERNPNASILLGAHHLSLAIIVATAIVTSSDRLAQGVVDALIYGMLGVVLQGLAFWLIDFATPRTKLRRLVDDTQTSPAAWAMGAVLIAVGIINAAAVS